MSSVLKRVIIRLLILAIVGGILYGLSQVTLSAEPKHYRVERADVRVEVQPDASLHVTEQLEFNFSGDFSGAYRDVHLAEGVRATTFSVSEDGEQYQPGGNTGLGSYDQTRHLRRGTALARRMRTAIRSAASGSSGTTRRSTRPGRSRSSTT